MGDVPRHKPLDRIKSKTIVESTGRKKKLSAMVQAPMPIAADGTPLTRKGKKKIGKKAPQLIVNARIAMVYDLIRDGLNRQDILRFIAKHKYVVDKDTKKPVSPLKIDPLFDFGERMLDEYMSRANAAFEKLSEVGKKKSRGVSIARYNMLFTMAVQDKDIFNAKGVQNSLDKVEGNEAPKELQISFTDRPAEELQSRLADLLRKGGVGDDLDGVGEEEEDYDVEEESDSVDEGETSEGDTLGEV